MAHGGFVLLTTLRACFALPYCLLVQVFTAMCDAFSHGANDVANSIGPFAAIWQVYTTQMVSPIPYLLNLMPVVLLLGSST
jgi:sodium-dependent phosphate transporter